MAGRFLSRLVACSRCNGSCRDADSVTIYSSQDGRVLEICHESCLTADELAILGPAD